MTDQRILRRNSVACCLSPKRPKGMTGGFLRNGRQLEVGGSDQKYIATAACHLTSPVIWANTLQLPLSLTSISGSIDTTLTRSEEKAVF